MKFFLVLVLVIYPLSSFASNQLDEGEISKSTNFKSISLYGGVLEDRYVGLRFELIKHVKINVSYWRNDTNSTVENDSLFMRDTSSNYYSLSFRWGFGGQNLILFIEPGIIGGTESSSSKTELRYNTQSNSTYIRTTESSLDSFGLYFNIGAEYYFSEKFSVDMSTGIRKMNTSRNNIIIDERSRNDISPILDTDEIEWFPVFININYNFHLGG